MKQLSSLTLTLYALGGLVLCLMAGIILAQVSPYNQAMPAMDQRLLLDWLLAQAGPEPQSMVLAIWFLALCAAVGILVLNLCACTWTRLLPRLKNGSRIHPWLLLLAHVLMILILLGHLSQMTLGFKQEGVKLLAGQSWDFPDGLRLGVEQVQYVNDPGLLNLTYRQARAAHTREAFSRELNLVRISLWRGDQKMETGVLRILEPLSIHGLRLTLSDFYRDDSSNETRVGAVFTASRNPLTGLFFLAYLAWITVYLLLTLQAFLREGKAPTK